MVVEDNVERFLDKIDPDLQKKILKKLQKLRESPNFGKPLRFNLAGKRSIRVDMRYRIVYEIDEKEKVVRVLDIDHRDSVYG